MEKKRSIGVTILAWIIIIFFGLPLKDYFDPNGILYLSNTLKPNGIIFHYIAGIMLVLQLIAAIFLLQQKEWSENY